MESLFKPNENYFEELIKAIIFPMLENPLVKSSPDNSM